MRVALGEAAGELAPAALPPLRLRVRSELPVGAGFGSSAAVAVAVIAGVLAWRGHEPDPRRVERLALEVERRQHGRPSGVDHGTVLRGGVQWAARDAEGALRLRAVAARPGPLRAFHIYDSGAPAESTGAVVAAVAERRRVDPAAFDAVLAAHAGGDGGVSRGARGRRRRRASRRRCGTSSAVSKRSAWCRSRSGAPCGGLERAGGAAKVSGAGALSGAAAGCLLVWPGSPPPADPAGWRRIECALGGPGLRLEAA